MNASHAKLLVKRSGPQQTLQITLASILHICWPVVDAQIARKIKNGIAILPDRCPTDCRTPANLFSWIGGQRQISLESCCPWQHNRNQKPQKPSCRDLNLQLLLQLEQFFLGSFAESLEGVGGGLPLTPGFSNEWYDDLRMKCFKIPTHLGAQSALGVCSLPSLPQNTKSRPFARDDKTTR